MTRILSLDDESEMLDLLCLIFRRAGYESLCTTDEQEALSILRTQPIDLLTEDFMRPGIGGWEFLRLMKSDAGLRDIPILGISAGPKDMRARQLKAMGLDIDRDLDGYVTKPYGPIELLDAVAAALTKRSKPVPAQAVQFRAKFITRHPT